MPELLSRAEVRAAQQLPFCYLCGKTFAHGADNHPDHLPPRAIFAAGDRDFPLKVSAHRACNGGLSSYDETIGQLIAVIHGRHAEPSKSKLKPVAFKDLAGNVRFEGFVGTGLIAHIGRWVRGFHAALYQQFLPDEGTGWQIHPPFAHGQVTDDAVRIERIGPEHLKYVSLIKKNRVAGRLDRIVVYNGKCVYDCVWAQADNGLWMCIFALRLYDWTSLADSRQFEKRGCVGAYRPVSGMPPNATRETSVEIPFTNHETLDPFGK